MDHQFLVGMMTDDGMETSDCGKMAVESEGRVGRRVVEYNALYDNGIVGGSMQGCVIAAGADWISLQPPCNYPQNVLTE